MAGTPTPRLGLHGPTGPDSARIPYDLDILRGQLDEAAIYRESAWNTRPAASAVPKGTLFRDTTYGSVAISDGTKWLTVAPATVADLSPIVGAGTDIGEEAYIQTSAMEYGAGPGIRWRVKKRATSSPRWEVVGGQSWTKRETNSGSTSSTSFVDVANGPSITVPHSGGYRLRAVCGAGATSGEISLRLAQNGVAIDTKGGLANSMPWVELGIDSISLAAGVVLTIQAKNSAGDTTTVANRVLELIPITFG